MEMGNLPDSRTRSSPATVSWAWRRTRRGATIASKSLLFGLIATAEAAEPGAEEGARQLLEEYRTALEAKQIDRLSALYVAFSEQQRRALQLYLDNATDLSVEVSDIVVTAQGDDVTVSFTRRDRFTDRESGRAVRLEVRLTKTVVKEGAAWKLAH